MQKNLEYNKKLQFNLVRNIVIYRWDLTIYERLYRITIYKKIIYATILNGGRKDGTYIKITA